MIVGLEDPCLFFGIEHVQIRFVKLPGRNNQDVLRNPTHGSSKAFPGMKGFYHRNSRVLPPQCHQNPPPPGNGRPY